MVCRRLVFLLFRAFQALMPGRAERFCGQLPRLRRSSLRHCLCLVPRLRHGSSSLRGLHRFAPRRISLSRPFFLLGTLAHLAPCSIGRSVEYAGTLLRSLPSQNATFAQTASQKWRVIVFAAVLCFCFFALFKRSSPVGLSDFGGSCRAPLRLRLAPLRRQVRRRTSTRQAPDKHPTS